MGILIGVLYIMLCLWIGTKLSFLDVEFSRKIAHMLISFWWFIAGWISPTDHTLFWVPIIVFLLFALINNIVGYKGIVREDGRKEYGVQCYCIAMFVFLLGASYFDKTVTYVGVFFMPLGYGDAMAAIIGKRYGKKGYSIFGGRKTFLGNVAMLVFSFFAVIIYTHIFKCDFNICELIIITILATIFEAIGTFGLDNLLMTCGTWMICYYCLGIGH